MFKEWDLTRDRLGDEGDAFNFDYNELITPWSNPSSYVDDTTDISIQLYDESGDDIKIAVFNTYYSSLALPPSKPQHLYVSGHNNYHPIIQWLANIEPDLDKYKIYRGANTQGYEPIAYSLIATIDAFDKSGPVTSYMDTSITIDTSGDLAVYYKITAVDTSSYESVRSNYDWVPFDLDKSNVGNGGKEIFPLAYSLSANYPNPFNPVTTIDYSIKFNGLVSLKVYDILGNEVATLVNENKSAGFYSVNFNASDLSSGIYIYTIKSGNFTDSKKLILLK